MTTASSPQARPRTTKKGSFARPAYTWWGTRNSGPGPKSAEWNAAGDRGGHHQGDERPGGELEEEQLDGQHDGGQGSAEGGGHPRRRPAGQEDLSFGGRHG